MYALTYEIPYCGSDTRVYVLLLLSILSMSPGVLRKQEGIVVGPPLRRPPPGWDDPAGVAQGRWAWGQEPPGEVQRKLAPRYDGGKSCCGCGRGGAGRHRSLATSKVRTFDSARKKTATTCASANDHRIALVQVRVQLARSRLTTRLILTTAAEG